MKYLSRYKKTYIYQFFASFQIIKSLELFGANLIIVSIILFFSSCRRDEESQPENESFPNAVNLIFPFENSECNEGTNVTETESTILFEWFAADFTDEYELNVINLENGEISTVTTTNVRTPLTLTRATPYAWYVVSKSADTDSAAQSERWNFYNAGEGNLSYAPFPATIIHPSMSATVEAPAGEVTLSWQGEDADEDISGYDVYFGEQADPPLISESNISQMETVSVSSGNVYYWRINTRDQAGHSSNSGIIQFRVL